MLYKLSGTDGRFDAVEPVAFGDFASFGQLEKDLEDLIARNILGVLFEDAGLMPIYQERPGQQAADIYALDAMGDLSIFELKRSAAGEGAVNQALRYAQDAGQWSHAQLEDRFRRYQGEDKDLAKEHQEAFDLDAPLGVQEFNRRQHIVVIGSGVDDHLINAVDYWRRQGISIDFLPYRIYKLADERYFEFFALPYDRHRNPRRREGRPVRHQPNLQRGFDLVHGRETTRGRVRRCQALRRTGRCWRHGVLLAPVVGNRCGGKGSKPSAG